MQAPRSKLPANYRANRLIWLLTASLLAVPQIAKPQEKVNPTGAQVKAFLDRVNAYVEARQQLEQGLTPVSPGDRSSGVEQREAVLADRIRAARRGARPGDLFGAAAPLFKEILVRDRVNRGPRDTGAALQEVPPRSIPAVNSLYPRRAPLATVPPLILANLPPLPDSLEYRFLGLDLILRDRASNLVVDLIPGALPAAR
jgi:hypothetical protein